ncbi:HAD family hydrolase [Streptomyces sp. NPDC054887]
MTSDATHPGPAAPAIEALREVVTGAACVLFGFDGPVCRLFAADRARRVTDGLAGRLGGHGHAVELTEDERAGDPYAVLRAAARAGPGGDLLGDLERELTREELRATATAWPTPYADPLIRTWSAIGVPLAITSYNSAPAVERYLAGRGLAGCFTPHVYGRTADPCRPAPDRDRVDRALAALGAGPGAALLIGEDLSDLAVAREAGVRFLGCARDDRRARLLRGAGANTVVRDLGPVLALVRAAARA